LEFKKLLTYDVGAPGRKASDNGVEAVEKT
jgi:hypothetical protein